MQSIKIDSMIRETPYRVNANAKFDGDKWRGGVLVTDGDLPLVEAKLEASLNHVHNGIFYLYGETKDKKAVSVETNGSFVQIVVTEGGVRAAHYHGSLETLGEITE